MENYKRIIISEPNVRVNNGQDAFVKKINDCVSLTALVNSIKAIVGTTEDYSRIYINQVGDSVYFTKATSPGFLFSKDSLNTELVDALILEVVGQ